MRVVKYFKGHVTAVLMVVVLLIAQAYCDLSLPNYTAKLVDVGIQQSGVENASPTVLTSEAYLALDASLSGDDGTLLQSAYLLEDDGLYHLTEFGRENRAALDSAVALPLTAYEYGVPAQALAAQSENIADQQAVAAAVKEYQAAGVDTSDLQLTYMLRTGAAMMGFVAAGVIIAALVGLLASRTGAAIGRELRSKLFARVVSFSDAEVQKFSAASLITRGTNDIQQIQKVSVMALRMVLYAPILAIGGIIMVARTDLSMGWIIAVGIVAVALVIVILFKAAMPKFRVMQKLIDRVNLVAREMLTGVSVVRAFGRQQTEQQRFDEASTNLMSTQLFTNRIMTFMMPAMMLIMNGISVLIVWVGGNAIDAGTMQTGDMIAFITYSMVIIMGFLMLGMLAIIIPRADVSAQRIDEVLETEPSITDPAAGKAFAAGSKEAPEAALHADGAQAEQENAAGKAAANGEEAAKGEAAPPAAPRAGGAEIAFDHVNFRYDDSAENVLSDIDFVAEAGKTTAIIGPTGSGKSTVLKLIERFYDASEGSVSIDGVDVRDISQHNLRAQLGYAPQQAFLFSGTVRSNVGTIDDDRADERLQRALQVAQVSDFVAALPQGVDSAITQGGTNVSGGQRQRLAIARALATDARAYLFDDSFSALDYKTDAALRRALATQMAGKTVVIVAQRIATVLHADKIVVLDDGAIVGQGTHQQLMESCETYREIAYSQLSEEELKGGDAA